MPHYLALLRGINVSGKNPLPMAELRKLFGKLGYPDAKTYIQTGNVAFEAPGKDVARLGIGIEAAIRKAFGFDVPVLLRTADALRAALSGNPYAKKPLARRERVYITFLEKAPEKAAGKALEAYADPVDELKLRGTEVYVLVRNGYGNTKLSNTFVEKKLGLRATTRNLETTAKLIELADSL